MVLFGSVHVLPPGLDWRPAALDAALASRRRPLVRAAGGPGDRAGGRPASPRQGVLPPGQSLFAPAAAGRRRAADAAGRRLGRRQGRPRPAGALAGRGGAGRRRLPQGRRRHRQRRREGGQRRHARHHPARGARDPGRTPPSASSATTPRPASPAPSTGTATPCWFLAAGYEAVRCTAGGLAWRPARRSTATWP